MSKFEFKPGDWVIYRKQKVSASPGPRAQMTAPSAKGETYAYIVEKFWVVDEAMSDGMLRIRTRRGKEHVVTADDPNLYRPSWWQRLWFGKRFRAVEQSTNLSTPEVPVA